MALALATIPLTVGNRLSSAIKVMPVLLGLISCGPSGGDNSAREVASPAPRAPAKAQLSEGTARQRPIVEPVAIQPVTLSDTDLGRVCRAAIASLNGRDPAIVKIERLELGVAYVRYARPGDGKVWKNRCKAFGDKVIWSTVDLDGPGTGPGRWRTHPADENVTFRFEGDEIIITTAFGDGLGTSDRFLVK
jgi:hypothetical protein